MARIVLCTLGSLGDLHPYLAVALGLRERGHLAVLATHPHYRGKVEALGLEFAAVRPELPDWSVAPELIARWMDRARGTERILREFVMPSVRETYTDTLRAAAGADVVVSHSLTLTVPLVVEKTGVRWASSVLAPIGLFSVADPPVFPNAPWMRHLRPLGPSVTRLLYALGKWSTRAWARPLAELRRELGLPAATASPFFEGQHSPRSILALFSRWFAPPPPDWPPQTRVTGFPFYDQDGDEAMDSALERFLDAGEPPIVFTLGSSAVHRAGDFYEESAAAARSLGRRAVLLVGRRTGRQLAGSGTLFVGEYARYSQLFPRAAAVVHQGGIGTTAQALRAGRPHLCVPFAHDQPDHAARLERSGVGRWISTDRYRASRVARLLDGLLTDPRVADRARALGERIRAEDGVAAACEALASV